MQLKTFQAGSMADCLTLVKNELGTSAVILHTRKVERRRWLGLRRIEFVEITAGKGMILRERKTQVAPVSAKPQANTAQLVAAQVHAPGKDLLGGSAAGTIATIALRSEIETVKSMLKDLAREMRNSVCTEFPEDLVDHYRKLIECQVAEEVARDIIRRIREQVRPEHYSQRDFVREKIAEQLEKLIPVAGPLNRSRAAGPHIVALIGPTGVGKTTTIAKLAANLKLREKRRIGMITIDTYRIAAIDQLKKYTDILGAQLKVVGSCEEMREAIAAMADCEFILIDTAGRSPNDTMKLNELKTFLDAANVDETHLVLSSTASQSCAELAMEKFGEVRYDKVIFTKLDEAVQVGVMLNVVRRVNKSISYVTTGQDVPDDIEVGRGRRIAQLILGMGL